MKIFGECDFLGKILAKHQRGQVFNFMCCRKLFYRKAETSWLFRGEWLHLVVLPNNWKVFELSNSVLNFGAGDTNVIFLQWTPNLS